MKKLLYGIVMVLCSVIATPVFSQMIASVGPCPLTGSNVFVGQLCTRLDTESIFTFRGSSWMEVHSGVVHSRNIRYDESASLGGGGVAVLGTIGGSGPLLLLQNQWIKVNVNGVDRFIPVW